MCIPLNIESEHMIQYSYARGLGGELSKRMKIKENKDE